MRLKSIVMVTIHAKNEGSTMLGLGCRWGWLDLGWVSFSNLRTSVMGENVIEVKVEMNINEHCTFASSQQLGIKGTSGV